MTNPLIEKFYELHPEKKEKPKPDYYKGEKSYAEELKELQGDFSVSVTTPTGTNIISATNASVSVKPKALQTYDVDSSKDVFLQIAEKVKQGDAKVTCVTFHSETVGMFSTGLSTVTFEVQYLDRF